MEKGGMKTRTIITAIAAVIGGALAIWRFGTSPFGIMSGLNVAVIIAIAGFAIGKWLDMREEAKQGYTVKDERTMLIEGLAGRTGFLFGNYVWLTIMWYLFIADHFTGWPLLETQEALLLGLLVNLGIYFTALFYYRKKV
jgi:hypothetical protein